MLSLTTYSDASYDSPKTVTVVSGWAGTVEKWERFAIDWKIMLAKYRVPYFHMKEYAHSRDAFEGWEGREIRRQNFLADAADIIASNASCSLACVIEQSAFDKINADYRLEEEIGNPYALAGIQCVGLANDWRDRKHPGVPIEHVFEQGDLGRDQLDKAMQWGHQPTPIFKPSTGQFGLTQLQAADFVAYEILKGHLTERQQHDDPIIYTLNKYRRSFRALIKLEPIWTERTEDEMRALCEKFNVDRRQK